MAERGGGSVIPGAVPLVSNGGARLAWSGRPAVPLDAARFIDGTSKRSCCDLFHNHSPLAPLEAAARSSARLAQQPHQARYQQPSSPARTAASRSSSSSSPTPPKAEEQADQQAELSRLS
jgi:hypothetical protein